MSIVGIAFGAIALAFISAICIIVLPTKRHKMENSFLLKNYKNVASNENDCLLLERLIMREQTYHRTYFVWQTLSKVSGILGIILSVCTLSAAEDTPAFYGKFFTILSILLVIFALYLLPEHKYRDYLLAYRRLSSLIDKITTGKIPIGDYANTLEKIESSITSDVE